jgi:hypothetical protein
METGGLEMTHPEVTQSPALLIAALAALAVAEAGCANHPARPASRVTVDVSPALLDAAHKLGYSPVLHNGKIIYCQREELTGSMVPTEQCIGEAALVGDIAAQREALQDLENARGQGSKQAVQADPN